MSAVVCSALFLGKRLNTRCGDVSNVRNVIGFGYETKHEMCRRQQCKKCKCGPVNVLRFHPKISTCIIHQPSTHINPGAGLI